MTIALEDRTAFLFLDLKKLLAYRRKQGVIVWVRDRKDPSTLTTTGGSIPIHSLRFLTMLGRLAQPHCTYRYGNRWFVDILDEHAQVLATVALNGARFIPKHGERQMVRFRNMDMRQLQEARKNFRGKRQINAVRAMVAIAHQETKRFGGQKDKMYYHKSWEEPAKLIPELDGIEEALK